MGQRTSPLEGVERLMKYIDFNFFRGKRVFVTGHTGFKGSWLCQVLVNAGAEVTGYSLPAPTEPSLFALTGLESRMKSITGDIRDLSKLREVYDRSNSEVVLHLAAQPIVRTSYEQPVYTYETNVMGTVNLLECIRTAGAPPRSVVIITTDKVYENKEWAWGYRENDPLDGYDPYSNSKSCAELAVHSYVNSFFKNSSTAVSTARAGNVIGGGDFARDLVLRGDGVLGHGLHLDGDARRLLPAFLLFPAAAGGQGQRQNRRQQKSGGFSRYFHGCPPQFRMPCCTAQQ